MMTYLAPLSLAHPGGIFRLFFWGQIGRTHQLFLRLGLRSVSFPSTVTSRSVTRSPRHGDAAKTLHFTLHLNSPIHTHLPTPNSLISMNQ